MVTLRMTEKEALRLIAVVQYGRRFFTDRKIIDEILEALWHQVQ